MSWTDERIESLKMLYADGLSAGRIAIELGGGLTRNGVIGKVNRLGLDRRRSTVTMPTRPPPSAHRKTRPVPRAQFKPRVRPETPPKPTVARLTNHGNRFDVVEVNAPTIAPEVADDAIPIGQRKTLLELGHQHCRWPCGAPGTPDFYFCGEPTADFPAKPYCPEHAARAYQGRTPVRAERWPTWAGGGRGRKSGRARA